MFKYLFHKASEIDTLTSLKRYLEAELDRERAANSDLREELKREQKFIRKALLKKEGLPVSYVESEPAVIDQGPPPISPEIEFAAQASMEDDLEKGLDPLEMDDYRNLAKQQYGYR